MCLQVKAATGEEVSAEDLGGADLHCKYGRTVFVIYVAFMSFWRAKTSFSSGGVVYKLDLHRK